MLADCNVHCHGNTKRARTVAEWLMRKRRLTPSGCAKLENRSRCNTDTVITVVVLNVTLHYLILIRSRNLYTLQVPCYKCKVNLNVKFLFRNFYNSQASTLLVDTIRSLFQNFSLRTGDKFSRELCTACA